MPHRSLIAILNKWFFEFCTIIQSHGGTIDKFIGDCIMALFGAPQPLECPEMEACEVANAFNAAMDRVKDYAYNVLGVEQKHQIEYRVGIDAGRLYVGNLGFSEHINYTVCGDAAHIAGKLEQLGKEYLVTPLISKAVRDKVHGKFLCMFVDIAAIADFHGRSKRVTVYHLMCARSDATEKDLLVKKTFSAIHQAFLKDDAEEARRIVNLALESEVFLKYYTVLRTLLQRIDDAQTVGVSLYVPRQQQDLLSIPNREYH